MMEANEGMADVDPQEKIVLDHAEDPARGNVETRLRNIERVLEENTELRRKLAYYAGDSNEGSKDSEETSFSRDDMESGPKYSGLYLGNPLRKVDIPYKIKNPYIIAAISTMGGFMYGAAGSNLTPFIGAHGYNVVFNIGGIQQGGMSGAFPGGALVGSVLSSMVAEKLGRKIMIRSVSIIWMIGAAVQVAAPAIPERFHINAQVCLALGRIVMGMAVGFASSNVPMYLQELSPPHIRGRLASCFQLVQTLGILIMYIIAWGCSNITANDGRAGMELAWGLMMIPGALYFVGSLMLTESPRWMATQGDWDGCIEALTFLRGESLESPAIQEELREFEEAAKEELGKKVGFADMFRGPSFGRTWSAIWVMFYQMMIGTNIVLFYASSIITMMGYSGIDVFRFTTIWYAINFGMTLPAVFYMDRWSRRWMFIAGSISMMTSMIIIAAILGKDGQPTGDQGLCTWQDGSYNCQPTIRQQIPQEYKAAGKAALAFSILFFAFFAITWGPAAWVYISEVFPPKQRAMGNAIGAGTCWLFNFVVAVSAPAGFINITYKMYVIYAVIAFVSIPHVFFFIPETVGYTLDEVQKVFTSNVRPYQTDPLFQWLKGLKK